MDKRLFLVLIALVLAGCLGGEPSFEASVSGKGPGWINITISSSTPLENASLSIARNAELIKCEDNTCLFRYWVYPGDKPGNYTARLYAYTRSGEVEGKLEIPISLSGQIVKVGNTFIYGPNVTGTLRTFNSSDVSVLAFFDPGKTHRNSAVVQAEMVAVAGLVAMNKTVHYYAVGNGTCIYTIPGTNQTREMNLDDCLDEARSRPIIEIQKPDYPTSQVLAEDHRLILQGRPGDMRELASETIIAIAKALKTS